MLVLSRKQNESIQIDAEIQVTVISITKGRVKLGISAPKHIRIIRDELKDQMENHVKLHEEIEPQSMKS